MCVIKHQQKLLYELYEYLNQTIIIKEKKNKYAYWTEYFCQ